MARIDKLQKDIEITRRELKNIRQELFKQKANMKIEIAQIKSALGKVKTEDRHTEEMTDQPAEFFQIREIIYPERPLNSIGKEINPILNLAAEEQNLQINRNSKYLMTPIGYISSCFKFKNGIPRQPSLCPTAKGTLKIEKSIFNNPEHSLINLNEFSHIWILFLFHKNGNNSIRAKIHPPRLNGASVGVFSTRSPHRPSAIGLSLTKLDKIKGDTLFLSGIDVLDGTPVLDIKPYIPMYDNPVLFKETKEVEILQEKCPQETSNPIETLKSEEVEYSKNHSSDYKVPEFLRRIPQNLNVSFTSRALADLEDICSQRNHELCFQMCQDTVSDLEVKQSIVEVLQNDPRSIYRRNKCSDKLYYFCINNLHVTCWFDDSIAEVLRIKLKSASKIANCL